MAVTRCSTLSAEMNAPSAITAAISGDRAAACSAATAPDECPSTTNGPGAPRRRAASTAPRISSASRYPGVM